jgi:NADH-ubiquinone oxidoreductase chain 6
MELLLHVATLNSLLPLLAIISGIFVITTKNAIISVFNLIVLYILVSFYLIYIGVTYLGISYIIIYIGAIAILFLFIIMMIDVEVVEKRSNNYLPLLFLFLSGFLFSLKKVLHNIGLVKMKSLSFKEEKVIVNGSQLDLYSKLESLSINNTNNTIYNNNEIKNNNDNNNGINNSKENHNTENVSEIYENYLIKKENSHFETNFQNENFYNINSNDYENDHFHLLIKDDPDKSTFSIDNLIMEIQSKIP